MKKIYLLFLLVIALYSCQSQEEINFEVGYLPEYKYTLSQNQVSENTIRYKGSEETLNKLKNKGVQNPTIIKSESKIKSISETGELDGNSFPLKVELLESSNKRLSPGTKFYGKIVNGNVKIDSISSDQMSKELRNVLLNSMETAMNQIKYPKLKIKIGESFDQTSTMKIPVGNFVTEILIKSIYTLKKVNDKIGYFDLKQDYKIKSKNGSYEMKVDGNGTGQIEYDTEKQFFTKYRSEMVMNIQTKLDSITMDLEVKSSTQQETKVQRASR